MTDRPPLTRTEHAILWIAAPALFATVTIDTSSVLLRLLGRSLPGSTEVIQFGIVPATSVAVVFATYVQSHAVVHVLLDRLNSRHRGWLTRAAQAALFMLFAAFAVATAWLFSDTLTAPEHSDLLGLPVSPLRLVWCLALVLCAILSLVRFVRHPIVGAPDGA